MDEVIEHQRIASYGLIVQNGAIVLCRLVSTTSSPGQWTLPGGGLEFGEDPEDALRREVCEETGLVVRSAQLAMVNSEVIPGEGAVHHALRIVYKVEADGELICEVDGSTDLCAWVPLDEARALPLVPFVRYLLEGQGFRLAED